MHRKSAILACLAATLGMALMADSGTAQQTDVAQRTKDLKSTDPTVRHDASDALRRCGAGCREAEQALAEMFQKGGVGERLEATQALTGIISDVESSAMMDAMVRGMAQQPAAEAGRAAKQADCRAVAPMVSADLAKPPTSIDPNEAGTVDQLRMASARLLGLCGGRAEVANLVPLLKNPSAAVRQEAASALLKIGPAAAEAVPALRALLEDPDPAVRQAVQGALKAIGGK